MISLFDWYDQDTSDLHYSLKAAGYDMPTIVLDETGFLPDDVMSPYSYYAQWSKEGKACYFNEVPVDAYEEIAGNNNEASVLVDNQPKAKIYFQSPGSSERIVKEVLWHRLGEESQWIARDYYNQYGFRYAQVIYAKNNIPAFKHFYHQNGEIVITENLLVGKTILNENKKIRIFERKIDFIKYFLQEAGLANESILYNTLSNSFLVTLELPRSQREDVLFWHEKLNNIYEVPGNMNFILDGNSATTKIYFQINEDYQAIKALNQSRYQMINYIGTTYPIVRQNHQQKEILIMTNSDQIESLKILVENLPNYHFSIAALTEMSSVLMDYQKYDNVHLYPNVAPKVIEELFDKADIYLDINYANEILNAVRRAFEQNMVIFSFNQTIHQTKYIAKEHIYDAADTEKMISAIQHLDFSQALEKQLQAAGQMESVQFKKIFEGDKE